MRLPSSAALLLWCLHAFSPHSALAAPDAHAEHNHGELHTDQPDHQQLLLDLALALEYVPACSAQWRASIRERPQAPAAYSPPEPALDFARTHRSKKSAHHSQGHQHSHSHQHSHEHGHDGHAHGHAGHKHETVSVPDLLATLTDTDSDSTQQFSQAVLRLTQCASSAHCDILFMPRDSETGTEGHDSGEEGAQMAGGLPFKQLSGGGVAVSTKIVAGLLLFAETVVGMLIPPFVSRLEGHEWWLGLLNSFAGGIFLAAGLMHLVPHCEEAQLDVDVTMWNLPDHYPLYLLLICLGYLLVFAVERVVLEGHDHGHSHIHAHPTHTDNHHIQIELSPTKGLGGPGATPNGGGPGDGPNGVRRRYNGGPGSAGRGPDSDHDASDYESSRALITPASFSGAHTHAAHFSVLRGIPLLVGMSIHTFLECLALGLISKHASFMVLLAAIAAHKGVSALALASKFTKEGATIRQVVQLVGPFTLLAPTAIATGHIAGALLPPALQLLLNCLACGTFLYVGASEILTEEFEGDVRAGRRDMSQRTARILKFAGVMTAVWAIALLGLMPHVH